MLALRVRRRTGRGQIVDISLQEAVMSVALEAGPHFVMETLSPQVRTGKRRRTVPIGHYRTNDGAVTIVAYMPWQWQALAEWIQEETGAVLWALQNYRPEPFTADTLRTTSTPGAVFLLDVPRVSDPVRVCDQMKLAAKRMAQNLDAVLVDDNRRALDDAAFAAIREQVRDTAAALEAAR